MSILTLSLVSHFTLMQFKPLNIFKAISTTQTVESVAKINPGSLQEVFRRQA